MRSQPKGRVYSALLKEWQECLNLNPLEKVHFDGEIQALSKQIHRLEYKHARIAAFAGPPLNFPTNAIAKLKKYLPPPA